MHRKTLFVLGSAMLLIALLLAAGVASSQEPEEHPIVTTANNVVGVGSYVAAEAAGLAGATGEDGAEDTPAQAFIVPFGIYPDNHLLDIAEFEQPEPFLGEGWTYSWSLAVPEGSASELVADGPVAIFMADVEGQYDLTLAVVDPEGFEGETTWAVTATTYVGGETCAMCHADQAALWQETGHATILTEGLNGTLSDHYGEGCIGPTFRTWIEQNLN